MNKRFFGFMKGFVNNSRYPMYAYILGINGGVYLAW